MLGRKFNLKALTLETPSGNVHFSKGLLTELICQPINQSESRI